MSTAEKRGDGLRVTVHLDDVYSDAQKVFVCISRVEAQKLDLNARRALRRMLVSLVEQVTGDEG